MIEHDEPATYGGDAPHVDVPTSIDAANEAFSKLVMRQKLVLIGTGQRREKGYTVKEFRDKEKFHHGTASSLFTTLHMRGLLVALTETRNGATVYVLPEYVNGRETRPYRRLARKGLKADIAAVIEQHRMTTEYAGNGHTEPREAWATCSCGAHLWEWQEFYNENPIEPEDAHRDHLAEEIARIL